MSKIGDLFIKLGLKKDDFNKGIDEAEKQVKGFSVSTKAMATAAAAAWAAVAAAVVKFAKDAVKYTQTWGDTWNVTMAGVKGAYSAFVRQLSSGEGFDNLFANMREAARVARETAAELDKVFERNNSYAYEEAKALKEIEQARTDMNDASKSPEEQAAAAKFVREEEERLGNLKVSNYKKEAQAKRDILKSQTQLQDDQIEFLVEEYGKNEDLIDQARQYREERKKAMKEARAGWNNPQAADLAAEQAAARVDAAYSDGIKKIAEWTKLYDKGNDEIVAAMVEAETRAMKAEADIIVRKRRADRTLGRLESEDTGGKSAIQTQVKDDVSSLEQLEQALERADRKRKALLESHQDIVPMTVDVFGIEEGIAAMDADFDEFWAAEEKHYQKLIDEKEKWKQAMEELGDAVAGGFSDACQELMNQLMGLDDFNPGAVVQALLTPLADMAIKAGEIIVAEGVAVEAAKAALTSFAGVGAIGAGALLIAAGTAAKAGLAALAKAGSASTATASNYGGSGTAAATQNIETELTIHDEGRISGSDTVLAGERTLNDWSR